MAFNTTPDSEDWDYFYFTNHPQPIRTMESSMEILPYRLTTLADISCTRSVYRCIGRQGQGLLADQCKMALSENMSSSTDSIPRSITQSDNGWTEAERLVKLARSCLCECCQTQLTDVVVAWVNEIENPIGATVSGADSVVDPREMGIMSRVVDITPVKTLVAASVATREVFSKVFSFWS
jgi:hypothetical protein